MGNQKNLNGQYHYSAKLLPNKSSNYYSNAYKKNWNNSGTICFLNVILLTLDIILYTRLTEFHMFFLTQLDCLHNFRVDILSNKEAILRRCTLKELRSKLATMMTMCCYRCFFRSLAKFTEQLFYQTFSDVGEVKPSRVLTR